MSERLPVIKMEDAISHNYDRKHSLRQTKHLSKKLTTISRESERESNDVAVASHFYNITILLEVTFGLMLACVFAAS